MDFRRVMGLASLGLLVGVGGVLGVIPAGTELWLWIAIAIVASVVIARGVSTRHFANGFLTGFVGELLACLVQLLWFDTYLARNPAAAQSFGQLPPGMSPRLFVLVLTPIVAIVYGLALGAVCWLVARVVRR